MFAALAMSAGLVALPVMAAPPPSHSGTATINQTTAGTPSQRNPLLADNGDVRMGKLIGTDVYNEHDQKLGSIDDVLMGASGQPDVVLKVKGNLVEVPWSKLQFGNAQQNGDNKVIMPGATQDALNSQQHFHYHANQNG
jgi:Flp pilus assembly protein CpaB